MPALTHGLRRGLSSIAAAKLDLRERRLEWFDGRLYCNGVVV
jgi:hypothetical protein